MNLLLFDDSDLISQGLVKVQGRRAKHLVDVHRSQIGDTVRVGKVDGQMGVAEILALSKDEAQLRFTPEQNPPAKLPLTLYLALPRPKFLSKCLQTATTLGVKRIVLLNAYKVEKVYWSCDQLTPESVREACLLGLEQARDTVLPEVLERRLFKPFVEDELPHMIQGTSAFIAHPGSAVPCPYHPPGELSLAVGPEGGFTDYEVKKLVDAGFTSVALTERILKVETAITALISRLT
jgi:RsmE family RNA methyltransferase